MKIRVRGVIIHDDKVLCVLNNNKTQSKQVWCLPGGGIDPGETTKECVFRELEEELGVADIQIDRLLYTAEFLLENGQQWIEYVYLIKNGKDFFGFESREATHNFELLDYVRAPIDSIEVDLKPRFVRDGLRGIINSGEIGHFVSRV